MQSVVPGMGVCAAPVPCLCRVQMHRLVSSQPPLHLGLSPVVRLPRETRLALYHLWLT